MSKMSNKVAELIDRRENHSSTDNYNPNQEVECECCGSTFPNHQHLAPTYCEEYNGVFFMCEVCIVEKDLKEN